jgi:hypothetical protein
MFVMYACQNFEHCGRTIPVNRLITHRTWSAFAFAALVIAAAPVIVVTQTGRANDPWNDPWSGPWPALLDRPVTLDPELAALQQRIDASLERLMKFDSEAALPGKLQVDSGAVAHWFPSQVAEREP